MNRKEAVAELARYGIKGEEVYLIDTIPLIEILWADGKAQKSEVDLLDAYLRRLVSRVNTLAGSELLTMETARDFVIRYLQVRPDPELLKTLRGLVAPTLLASSDEEYRDALKSSMLAACVDIASSAVREYPYGMDERFDADEKRCYFEIVDSLG